MESSYADDYASAFLSVAFENQIGGGITLSQLRILLEVLLPLRKFDIHASLELVQWIQVKNHSKVFPHILKEVLLRPST